MRNIGIIGCGQWGAKHARVCQNIPGWRLIRVADLQYEKAQALAQSYSGVTACRDFQELLADPQIEAVILATPASTHYDLALMALEAGKHTLVEKPLTLQPQQSQGLLELSHQRGLTLMVGHTFEYNPAIEILRTLVQSGELGTLYYLDMARLNLGLYQRDVNVVYDLCPHDISMMIAVLGERPISVSARGHSLMHGGVIDMAYIEYRFAGGLAVNSQVSWLAPLKVRQMTLVGSRKMVIFDDTSLTAPIRIFETHITPPDETERYEDWQHAYHYGPITTPAVPGGEPLRRQAEHFFACIGQSAVPLTDGVNGRNVVSVLDAVQRSIQNRARPFSVYYMDDPHVLDKNSESSSSEGVRQ
jgi:predicted dehydrogenase